MVKIVKSHFHTSLDEGENRQIAKEKDINWAPWKRFRSTEASREDILQNLNFLQDVHYVPDFQLSWIISLARLSFDGAAIFQSFLVL